MAAFKLFSCKLTYKRSLQFVAEWLLLFLIIVIYFYRDQVSYNEMDVVPYARAVYNDQWLPNDWYLNLKIQYRFVFSYLIGWLVEIYGYNKAIIFGRLFTYLLTSISFCFLIWKIEPNRMHYIYLCCFVIFCQFFGFGYGAGEWIVGGIETKVLAYACAILSLAFFIDRREVAGSFFAGLTFSFHLLIGIFHTVCLIPFAVLVWKNRTRNISDLFVIAIVFTLGGLNGIYGIFMYLMEIGNASDNIGWDFYVNFRVAHHVLPSNHYYVFSWLFCVVLSLINILLIVLSKEELVKKLSGYAILTSVFTLIGWIIFLSDAPRHLMRFYFFRYTDVMLPLMSLMVFSYILIRRSRVYIRNVRLDGLLFVLVSMTLLIPKAVDFLSSNSLDGDLLHDLHIDREMQEYVKEDTERSGIFLVPPDFEKFYLTFDRSMFVSFKHCPQNNDDLKVWKNRLEIINYGEPITSSTQVLDSFYKMSEVQINHIRTTFPQIKYLIQQRDSNYPYKVIHKTDDYILYHLE